MIVTHSDGSMTWQPSFEVKSKTNLWDIMQNHGFHDVDVFQSWSYQEQESFIQLMLKRLKIDFHKKPESILNYENPQKPTWFSGSEFNIVENCFKGNHETLAIISKSPHEYREWSYRELYQHMQYLIKYLLSHHIKKGDRVGIYMPMTPESITLYLAVIAVGASAVTIAESFSPKEMKVRLEMTNPKLIFTQNKMSRSGREFYLYDKLCSVTEIPVSVLELTGLKLRAQDSKWVFKPDHDMTFPYVYVSPNTENTILFSSGTTGLPKAIPWFHHTPLKCAFDGHLHQDIQEGDRICWPTSLGWMMGPWLIFASLINKACICIYEDAPTSKDFASFVDLAKINILGMVPSLLTIWKENKCMESISWSSIKCFSSTGEASIPKDIEYLMKLSGGKPIIEYCGGTEIGGGYISSTLLKENRPGQFNSKVFGLDWDLYVGPTQNKLHGDVFIKAPALGLSTSLLNKSHEETYFKNCPKSDSDFAYRQHGDVLKVTAAGYYRTEGRVDDCMNLGGIKVSGIQLEEVISELEPILECAAISITSDDGGPEKLILFLVIKYAIKKEDIHKICQKRISDELNPLYKLEDIVIAESLPRTPTNKVKRRKLRESYLENLKRDII